MKTRFAVIFCVIPAALNLILGLVLLNPAAQPRLDLPSVNDVAYSCSNMLDGLNVTLPEYEYRYAVLDNKGELFYSSDNSYSPNLQEAILNRDTIIDLPYGASQYESIKGKLIISNDYGKHTAALIKRVSALLIASTAVMLLTMLGYMLYLNRVVFRPFNKLKDFAVRVAGGNLDFTLAMDKNNTFGAFTESFDLMRDELKRAREQERLANRSKKELIAQLSHDIKTPIASIKAVAEVMSVSASDQKTITQLAVIENKADQVDSLISNLFNATLEELQQLEVTAVERSSQELYSLIEQADYMKCASIGAIPECLLLFDPLRLQQVLDNILSNSYKYAKTNIDITASFSNVNPHTFIITIQDYGQGVLQNEISLIFEKFYRCENAEGKSGSGLGLYISRYLMDKMGGSISCRNNDKGFCTILNLRIS